MNTKLTEAIDKVLSDETNVRIATASHQAEFPYGQQSEAGVTRREFCGFLFLTSSTLLAATAGFAAKAVYDSERPLLFRPASIDGAVELEPGISRIRASRTRRF